MVPRVTAKGGRSFAGALAYFTHDLGSKNTAERVRFVLCENMLTQDPEKAAKVMAWTADHWKELKQIAGGKVTKSPTTGPVYTMVLSWAEHQNPTDKEMIEFARRSLEALGVQKHEAVIVGHNDTEHSHVHLVINRVDPVTGKWWTYGNDELKLSRLSQAYEQECGQILCPEREINNRARDLGDYVKHQEAPRKLDTEEYQQRRAERMEAQQKAAALVLEKQKAQETARDLAGGFDGAAAHDDRQHRAREIDPPQDEAAARADWKDEQAKERERMKQQAKEEQEAARFARKEQQRRGYLDGKRAAEWQAYEVKEWQALNDKQTTRRETLHERQSSARQGFELRQAQRYTLQEKALSRRVESLVHELDVGGRGIRGFMNLLTGKTDTTRQDLEAAEKALERMKEQQAKEREQFEEKQRAGREAQHKRHEEERERRAQQLAATKTKQDTAFEQKERERAARLADERAQKKAQEEGRKEGKTKETDALRFVIRERITETERTREDREREAAEYGRAGLSRDFGQAQGRGLGLER